MDRPTDHQMPGSPPAAKCPTSLLSPLLSLACPSGEHLWDSRPPCWGGGRVCIPPPRPTFSLLTSTGTHLALPVEDRVLGTLLPPHVGGHRPNWQAQSNDEVCARRCPPGGPPTRGWCCAGAAEDRAAGHQPRLPVSAMLGPPVQNNVHSCHLQHRPGVQTSALANGHTLDGSLWTFVSSKQKEQLPGTAQVEGKTHHHGIQQRSQWKASLSISVLGSHARPLTCPHPCTCHSQHVLFLLWLWTSLECSICVRRKGGQEPSCAFFARLSPKAYVSEQLGFLTLSFPGMPSRLPPGCTTKWTKRYIGLSSPPTGVCRSWRGCRE